MKYKFFIINDYIQNPVISQRNNATSPKEMRKTMQVKPQIIQVKVAKHKAEID